MLKPSGTISERPPTESEFLSTFRHIGTSISYGRVFMKHVWWAVPTLFLSLACGGGGSPTLTTPPAPPAPSMTHQVAPNTADPATRTFLNPHVAITPDPVVPAKNRLFVFLPGTGGQPLNQQLILKTGSLQGYHAIGLMYPNTPSVGSLCDDSTDPNAHWDVRREIITGQDYSTLVAVPPSESVEHRLTALLGYLNTAFPSEHWGQFLSGGQPAWNLITVAGHSQGGGHAGVLAKLHPVARAVCFSSPADWRSLAAQPATWYATPGATPASQVFGFSHQQDELVIWPLVAANWVALGLDAFGAVANVDSATVPFADSHRLTSDAPHAPVGAFIAAPFHSATVVDAVTPLLNDGTPRYRPVWIQLCFP